ncbi:MAG: hypothetical protein O4753_06990, partial [Trichodesmium sp. St7_bin2_1]|nr:hypothetical protein [Trichodesmium sp. St7_bin2_1]
IFFPSDDCLLSEDILLQLTRFNIINKIIKFKIYLMFGTRAKNSWTAKYTAVFMWVDYSRDAFIQLPYRVLIMAM